ncbi:hypothetical protein EMIHUDRAFT_233385 [Emiliania huxleyi CCMP1516]|uniref:Uncharacterized protein n=2 Tax=Emiliania huxleyi TaxID=2903 RepID=A0A0D3K248_EMIH1|nr:hypothetical protein EMIHUDRAFT_233385 [Emiliania huxleyi CCMP1516]EOD29833.1 hypothetical protein EMIHUDRAFT_233385 [Emiliania huxleyi CCMP1516]|eukprot:XP_005782262.1 hypothetical protein EMIHUDRAFT_233385 [Emiliania huxleyi CCMP1516]
MAMALRVPERASPVPREFLVVPWSTWSAVINLTSRAGELRSAPSGPDGRYRVAGKRALALGAAATVADPGLLRGYSRARPLPLAPAARTLASACAPPAELGWKGAYVRFGNTETGLLKLVKGRGKWSPSEATAAADCDLRLFDFEAFGGFGKEVRSTLREAANQLSNKLSHAQHLDEVTWTTKNWHGLQMQRLSVVLHTAVAWQTVNELACGESGIVHGAECIAVLNGVA